MKGFGKEFKEFISKGNVIDMAVGIIVGGAFTTIVNSLVNDIVMPLIGGVTGGLNFTDFMWKIGEAEIKYGQFIQNIVSFLIVALVIFSIVKAMNKLRSSVEKKPEETEEAAEAEEPAAE